MGILYLVIDVTPSSKDCRNNFADTHLATLGIKIRGTAFWALSFK